MIKFLKKILEKIRAFCNPKPAPGGPERGCFNCKHTNRGFDEDPCFHCENNSGWEPKS
jgi:hypothetical protein